MHGIVLLFEIDDVGQPKGVAPTNFDLDDGHPRWIAPAVRMSLPDVVHRFKTLTTKHYTDGVKQFGWMPYNGRVWQRNYYEHIIRSERSLQRIRDYIDANPMKWGIDPENPAV
jgi:hypothetical protein